MEPLLDYEVKSLLDDPNILRDSVLIQMECLYFEAYVHVGAIMWRVVFRELRGLTNSKGLELNPMALNRYDPSPNPKPITNLGIYYHFNSYNILQVVRVSVRYRNAFTNGTKFIYIWG